MQSTGNINPLYIPIPLHTVFSMPRKQACLLSVFIPIKLSQCIISHTVRLRATKRATILSLLCHRSTCEPLTISATCAEQEEN